MSPLGTLTSVGIGRFGQLVHEAFDMREMLRDDTLQKVKQVLTARGFGIDELPQVSSIHRGMKPTLLILAILKPNAPPA